MVIVIFVSLLQIVNAVKNPSGNSLNYVSVFPAVALTLYKLINLKAATGNLKDLAVGAITVARVLAAGLGDVIDEIILADTCAGCHIMRNLRRHRS